LQFLFKNERHHVPSSLPPRPAPTVPANPLNPFVSAASE